MCLRLMEMASQTVNRVDSVDDIEFMEDDEEARVDKNVTSTLVKELKRKEKKELLEYIKLHCHDFFLLSLVIFSLNIFFF